MADCQGLVRLEAALPDLRTGAAIPLVICVYPFQSNCGLLQSREAKQAFPVGQKGARTRMLHDGGPAAGQVAQRPVADPRVLKTATRGLGATELAARPLNVRPVRLGTAGDLSRMTYPPPVTFDARPRFLILLAPLPR